MKRSMQVYTVRDHEGTRRRIYSDDTFTLALCGTREGPPAEMTAGDLITIFGREKLIALAHNPRVDMNDKEKLAQALRFSGMGWNEAAQAIYVHRPPEPAHKLA